MTARQYRDFMEAEFAEFIRPLIAKEIADKTVKLIGSASPLRFDHPGWGLALRLFKWDRAAKNLQLKSCDDSADAIGVLRPRDMRSKKARKGPKRTQQNKTI